MDSAKKVIERERAKAKREFYEATFLQHAKAMKIDVGMEREFAFHPTRKFRFDYAWPLSKVALEIQGGEWMGKSGHKTAFGMQRDCEKGSEALMLGWRVVHATGRQVMLGQA